MIKLDLLVLCKEIKQAKTEAHAAKAQEKIDTGAAG